MPWRWPLSDRCRPKVEELELSILVQRQGALAWSRLLEECFPEASTTAPRRRATAGPYRHRPGRGETGRQAGGKGHGGGRAGEYLRGKRAGLHRRTLECLEREAAQPMAFLA